MSKRHKRERPAVDPGGPFVIKIVGAADGSEFGHSGEFVRSYDAKYGDGRGFMTTTPNPRQAFAFPSMQAAHVAWAEVPSNRPVRPDGKPNKPMTAFTVEILKLEAALEEEHAATD